MVGNKSRLRRFVFSSWPLITSLILLSVTFRVYERLTKLLSSGVCQTAVAKTETTTIYVKVVQENCISGLNKSCLSTAFGETIHFAPAMCFAVMKTVLFFPQGT